MADKIHQHLIDTSPTYADSVSKGHTLRWDTAKYDMVPVDQTKPFGAMKPTGKPWISVPDYGTRDAPPSLTAQEALKLDATGKSAYEARKA